MSRSMIAQESGLVELTSIYKRMVKVVEDQVRQVEDYPHTPYTADSVKLLVQKQQALAKLGVEVRAWHSFIGEE